MFIKIIKKKIGIYDNDTNLFDLLVSTRIDLTRR